LNFEQPLTVDGETGLFARLGWNDGATESFAFTETERSASVAAQIAGTPWQPANDPVGIAFVANELGNAHADYLGDGGLGFVLGDGRLNRRPEIITETYYALQLLHWFALSVDYQFIDNPGYKRDRGPVSVVSLRGHIEGVASQM
jgi:high affinity Mn2+ porin